MMMMKGYVDLLGHTKFHDNRCMEVGTRPQKVENFHFMVKSRPTGANPLTDFYNTVRGFYTPNYPVLLLHILRDSLRCFYC